MIVFGAITYSNPSLKYYISQYNFIIMDECCRLVVPEVFQPKGFYGNELPNVKTTLYEMSFTKEEFIIGLASPTQMAFVDDDTLLVLVNPIGPACHKGTGNCWGEANDSKTLDFIAQLEATIDGMGQFV